MLVVCKNCSTKFTKLLSNIKRTKNHFCSKSCAATYNNKGRQKNPPTIRTCKHCNSKFTRNKLNKRSTTLCADCRAKFDIRSDFLKTLTLGEYQAKESVADKHPSWLNSHIRGLNRSWNKDMTKLPCANCNYDKHVELCHKKAITSFSLTTTLGEINARENNIQLCRNCHWEYDHGLLKI